MANEERYDFTVEGFKFSLVNIHDVRLHIWSIDKGKLQSTNFVTQNFLKQLNAQPCFFHVAAENVALSNCHDAEGGHAAKNPFV